MWACLWKIFCIYPATAMWACQLLVGMSVHCTRYEVYKVRAIYWHFQTCYLNFVVSSSRGILIFSRRCIVYGSGTLISSCRCTVYCPVSLISSRRCIIYGTGILISSRRCIVYGSGILISCRRCIVYGSGTIIFSRRCIV